MHTHPSVLTTSKPETGTRRRHGGLRRRTLSALGIALFLSGLVFGEAIEAVAQVLEGPSVTDEATAHVDPYVERAFARAEAAESAYAERAFDMASLAVLDAMHDSLVSLAPEGLTLERRAMWDVLADCESGDWYRGVPVAGSRRWDSTAGYFEGGLQFDPRTWDGFRDPDMPSSANNATPVQQMVVAERVLDAQGWGAWPVCSRKVGYR